MTLLAPSALLWLFAGIPIALIFLMRPQAVLHEVPSLLLWNQCDEMDRFGRFGRVLRRWASLILHLLVIALLATALTRPTLSRDADALIFVLDDSATMQTLEDGPTSRFDLARSAILDALTDAPPDVPVTIVAAGSPPTIISKSEPDRNVVRRALDGLRPRDVNPQLDAATSLARRLSGSAHPQTTILTDRLAPPEGLHPGDFWTKVGANTANVALTAMRPSDKDGALVVEWSQNGCHGERATLVVQSEQHELVRVPIELRDDHGEVEIDVNLAPATPFQVELQFGDGFLLDNTLYGVWPARQDPHLRLVTEGSENFAAVLSPPGAEVSSPAAQDWVFSDQDVVIFDAVTGGPGKPIPGRFIVFGGADPFGITGTDATIVTDATVSQWSPESSIVEQVDMLPWRIRRLSTFVPPTSAEIVARSERAPVIFVVTRTDGSGQSAKTFQAIYVNFRLSDSNVANTASFSALIWNMIDYLTDSTPEANALYQQTGAALSFPGRGASTLEIEGPGAARVAAYAEADKLIVPYTERAGHYQLQTPRGRIVRAANFAADRTETASLQPVAALSARSASIGSPSWMHFPLWMFAAISAAGIILVELILNRSGWLRVD